MPTIAAHGCCATHSLRRHHARGRVSVMSITSIIYRTTTRFERGLLDGVDVPRV